MKRPKTILVIDDDVDIVEAARLALEHGGYHVLSANTGPEGLDLVHKERVDLIILDVMLARDTEGFHIAQMLKADENLKSIPILMITSVATRTGFKFDPKSDGDYLPVDDYVEKPVDPQDLLARVKKLLRK
jgi:DNA-binding response OmpR family regulator